MIDEAKHIKELTSLGLSENEAKTYITLLTKNSMTVGEIAKISGVPRPKLYEILTKLIEKGLCNEKIGKVKRYRVVAPNIVAGKLIGDYQAQLEQKKIIAQNFSNTVNSIYKKNVNKTDPLDYIEVLKDEGQIINRFLTLQKNVKKEILCFSKEPYALPLTDNVNEEIEILKKKVKAKAVYEYKGITSESEKEKLIEIISCYMSAGEEARVIKELPMKMIIFDDKITMFVLNDPVFLKPSITAIIINHPSSAKTLKYVFENIWENSMTLEEFKIKGV